MLRCRILGSSAIVRVIARLVYIVCGSLRKLRGEADKKQRKGNHQYSSFFIHTDSFWSALDFASAKKLAPYPPMWRTDCALIFIKPVLDVDQELRAGISQLRSAIEECAGKLIWS